MRKVIVSEFVSLDGVMEAPDRWRFPFWHDSMETYKHPPPGPDQRVRYAHRRGGQRAARRAGPRLARTLVLVYSRNHLSATMPEGPILDV